MSDRPDDPRAAGTDPGYSAAGYVIAQVRLDGPVRLAAPDPTWPVTAEALVRDIRRVLGDTTLVLEHVGSTSVPSLAAKPVIDLVLTVPDPADEASYVPALEDLGYVLHIREPDWHQHRLLKYVDPAVNLHVFGAAASEVNRMIAFRDHLRVHDGDRALYESTKRDLAGHRWAVTQDYADAKTDVVGDIMGRALEGS